MTDKEKLKDIKKLADAMYYAAMYLTTDASRLRKAMDEYHQFIIQEYKEEPVSECLEEAAEEYVTKEGYLAGLHHNSMVRSFKAGAEWYASHNTKLPDNLLLAARKASIDMCNIDDKYLDEYPYHPIAEQKFIEGAEWQKEHLMKDAVDGEVGYWNQRGLSVLMSLPSEFEENDKCKIILIKED